MDRVGQLIAGLMLGALAGGAARAESYGDALRSARAGPRLDVSRARYLASSARTAIALADARPRLTIIADATRNFDSDVYGPRLRDQATAQLVVPILAGGRLRAGIAAARAEQRYRQEQTVADDLQLAVDVADVYAAVREARALRAVAGDEIDRLAADMRRLDAERRAGALGLTEVAEGRARLAAARRGALDADRQDADAAARFEELVGRPPGSDLAPMAVEPPNPAEIDAAVRHDNPELRALRHAIDAARLRVGAERALGRPTLTLIGSATYGNTGAAWVDTARIGLPDGTLQQVASPRGFAHRLAASGRLVLSVPLSRGGEVAARVARAEAARREMEERARAREAAVLARARQSLARARAALRQQALADEAVAAAREALKGVDLARSVGERSEHDVLVATTELADAGRQRARVERAAAYQAVVALAAAGRLPDQQAGVTRAPVPAAAAMRDFDLAALPGSRITPAPSAPRRPLAYDVAGLA